MKTIFLPLLFLTLILGSCRGDAIYRDIRNEFPGNQWQKDKPLEFPLQIDKTGIYGFEVFFSHVHGYQFPQVILKMEIHYPDTHVEVEHITLDIKKPDGSEAGDCAGDYCDLWHQIRPARALQKGHYNIKLSHEFPGPYLPNVLGVGLIANDENKR